MKNSKKYSQRLGKHYRSLKRKYKNPEREVYDEPLDALVFAIVSQDTTEKKACSMMKGLEQNFVDYNDLRVSLAEEIIEALGEDNAATRRCALNLSRALGWVFKEYNIMSLAELRNIGKRPAHEILENVSGASLFVINYVLLTSLEAHAIPLTSQMIDYLRENELVHPDADEKTIDGFLLRHVRATDADEFYHLLRRAGESPGRRKKGKKTTKKKKSKKNAKENTAKKSTKKTKEKSKKKSAKKKQK